MDDAGFILTATLVTFGGIAAYALYVDPPGQADAAAAAGRRQALAVSDWTRPRPVAAPGRRSAAVRKPRRKWAAAARARRGGRGRRGDRHAVPRLGGRLLLQRRRDRRPRRLRGGRRLRVQGTVADGSVETRRRHHDVHDRVRRCRHPGALRGRAGRDLRRVRAGRGARPARRRRVRGRPDRGQALQRVRGREPRPRRRRPAPTARPLRRDAARRKRQRGVRQGRASSSPSPRLPVGCIVDGVRHPGRRSPAAAPGADLRRAVLRRRGASPR